MNTRFETPASASSLQGAHGRKVGKLAAFKERADPEEALVLITKGTSEERKAGAVALRELMGKEPFDLRLSQKSFEPLLSAAEKEADKPVKIELLKALESTSNAGQFLKPADFVERMETLIFAETDRDVVIEATVALYHCIGFNDRARVSDYLFDLASRAETKFGKGNTVPGGISGAIGFLSAAGCL